MSQIDEKQIAVIEKKIAPIAKQATNLKITTQQEQNSAGEMLTTLNKYGDEMKALKETVTKPMNAALKAVRDMFKPRETKLEEAVSAIRKAMGAYQLEADRKVAEAEAKLAARVEKGTMKPETAVKKMDEIEHAETKIETAGGSGSVKFRTRQILKITDVVKLYAAIYKSGDLATFLTINESMLLLALKAGQEFEGAELETVKEVVNSR